MSGLHHGRVLFLPPISGEERRARPFPFARIAGHALSGAVSERSLIPVKRHRGEPGHTRDTGQTRDTRTAEPHNHPNPPMHRGATARRPNTGTGPGVLPVKRHRGEPGHTRDTRNTRTHKGTQTTQTNLTTIETHQQSTGKDIGGSRDTHGQTDHTDEPHKHPNPPTHPSDRETTASAADSTAASPKPTAPRGRLGGRPLPTRPSRPPLHRGEPDTLMRQTTPEPRDAHIYRHQTTARSLSLSPPAVKAQARWW